MFAFHDPEMEKRGMEQAVSRILFAPCAGGHSSARPTRVPGRFPLTSGGPPLRYPYLALLRVGFTVPFRSPETRWALTPPFHPYPATPGGLFSVALSLGSPPVPLRNHAALRSPDFPLRRATERPPHLLHPSPNFNIVFFHLLVKVAARNPEQPCGLRNIPLDPP